MKYTLKTRLVGAALLAAIALIFLPSFFKDKQLAPVSTQTQIPPKPAIVAEEFKNPSVPSNIEPAPAPDTMFMPKEQATVISEEQASLVPEEQSSSVTSVSSSAVKPKTEKPEQTSVAKSSADNHSSEVKAPPQKNNAVPVPHLNEKGIPDAWMVQVGGFATKEAADKIRDQLQAQGLRAFDRKVSNIKGVAAKVFVGPLLDKSQAANAKVQVDKQLKVNSIIVKFQP